MCACLGTLSPCSEEAIAAPPPRPSNLTSPLSLPRSWEPGKLYSVVQKVSTSSMAVLHASRQTQPGRILPDSFALFPG